MFTTSLLSASHKTLKELGLLTLWNSSLNTKLLCAQRFIRLFAYGGSTLILVSFLSALDISKTKIGLFMTLTMIGDTVMSFLCTYFADMIGRRAILITGSLLMIGAGIVFALCGNFWVLLAAAVVGVISPNGTECGPFRAIEESTIAHLAKEEDRGDIYAWYSLLGGIGSACGLGICGVILHFLDSIGWNILKAYHTIFWGYSALGVVMLIIVLFLSKDCERTKETPPPASSALSMTGVDEEKKAAFTSQLPKLSRKSRIIVIKLCILFALDSFAVSLAPMSWIIYFFHNKFALADNKLGTIFFATSFIAALSMLPASAFAKRFGNIPTMVLAHLPGAILLALIPIPSSLTLAVTFLVLRSSTQSMDTAPRSAFMAGIVADHERTPMMGFVLIAKSSASSVSPIITGVLAAKGYLWVAFVMAGVLMCVYDGTFWLLFGWERKAGRAEGDLERNGGFWNSAKTIATTGEAKSTDDDKVKSTDQAKKGVSAEVAEQKERAAFWSSTETLASTGNVEKEASIEVTEVARDNLPILPRVHLARLSE